MYKRRGQHQGQPTTIFATARDISAGPSVHVHRRPPSVSRQLRCNPPRAAPDPATAQMQPPGPRRRKLAHLVRWWPRRGGDPLWTLRERRRDVAGQDARLGAIRRRRHLGHRGKSRRPVPTTRRRRSVHSPDFAGANHTCTPTPEPSCATSAAHSLTWTSRQCKPTSSRHTLVSADTPSPPTSDTAPAIPGKDGAGLRADTQRAFAVRPLRRLGSCLREARGRGFHPMKLKPQQEHCEAENTPVGAREPPEGCLLARGRPDKRDD